MTTQRGSTARFCTNDLKTVDIVLNDHLKRVSSLPERCSSFGAYERTCDELRSIETSLNAFMKHDVRSSVAQMEARFKAVILHHITLHHIAAELGHPEDIALWLGKHVSAAAQELDYVSNILRTLTDTSGTDPDMIDARAAVDKLLTVYSGDDAGISVLLHAVTVDERDVKFDASQFVVADKFGIVYRGTYKGDIVAVKVPKSLADWERRGLHREAAVMLTLRHPNICNCGAVLRGNASGSKDAIIMEYDDGKTLYDALPDMPWKKRLQVLIDVATAVRYLHQQTVVHGDLTANNVMVGRDRAQLFGFGSSHCIARYEA